MNTNQRLGIVLNVKCLHCEEPDSWPIQCETIEGDEDLEYQGYRCPKCGHEICISIKHFLFTPESLKLEGQK